MKLIVETRIRLNQEGNSIKQSDFHVQYNAFQTFKLAILYLINDYCLNYQKKDQNTFEIIDFAALVSRIKDILYLLKQSYCFNNNSFNYFFI